MSGTVVAAFVDGETAALGVRVDEGGKVGVVEYYVEVPAVDGEGKAKDPAALQAELVAAAKEQRDAQLSSKQPIAGLKAGDAVTL